MTPDTLKFYFDHWTSLRSCFAYRGPFMDKYTNAILDISEQTRDHQPHISRKLSFMLVECFQNVLKHSESFSKEDISAHDDGMFTFKHTEDSFVINSINILRNEDVPRLVGLIEKVNELDEKELKKYYLEHLENNQLSEKGGAGLGLIELARKSGQKIKFKIEPLDDNYSQFHQQISFLHSNKENSQPGDFITVSQEYYNMIKRDQIFLHYKGDFTQKSVLPMLDMAALASNLYFTDKRKTQRAKHVLIEIIQNMSRMNNKDLPETQNATILLGRDEDHLFVSSGNIVSISEKVLLEEKLKYLLSLEEEELAALHRTTIHASLRFENKERTGLGLIEVVKGSSNNVQFQFYPIAHNQFLFVLCMKF
ncbi:MAG: SiaB family protein kinase [Flavobacteriales bacterium]